MAESVAINPYLAEAEALAEHILSRAIITSKGLCWPSISAAYSKDRIVRQPNFTLASGNAGISVFLCEAYRKTGNPNLLEGAAQAIDWLESECSKTNQGTRSLWFGQCGAVEAYLSLFEATQDIGVLEKARLLSIKCGQCFFDEDSPDIPITYSIGGGVAGVLLALLRVLEKTQDEEVREHSSKLVRLIASRSRLAPDGIYWDRMGDTIRPPIGFISGTSGILFVLAQAYKLKLIPFDSLEWLVGQGMRYENSFLHGSEDGWPDLSYSTWSFDDIGSLRKKIRQALRGGDDAFFSEFGKSSSWSNGVSGIALSRSAYNGITGSSECIDDIKRAKNQIGREIESGLNSCESTDFSLVGGLGGVGMSCLGIFSISGYHFCREFANRIGEMALKQRQDIGFYRSSLRAVEDGEDLGLLTGSAGIGYFMLKLSEERAGSSLLAPVIRSDEAPGTEALNESTVSKLHTVKRCLISVYPRTSKLLKTFNSDLLEKNIENFAHESSALERFRFICDQHLSNDLDADERRVFNDTYQIESLRQELDFCPRGDRYLGLKLECDKEINRTLLEISKERKLLGKKLQLSSEARIRKSEFRWSRNENRALVYQEETIYCLFHQRPYGVFEAKLPQFNYLVLSGFEKPNKPKTVIKRLIHQLSPKTEAEREKVLRTAFNQIKEAMENGLLCCK